MVRKYCVGNKIINERRKGTFKDFFDFKNRMGSEVNSRMLENLINASFFDSFGLSHAYMMQNIGSSFEQYISSEEALSDIKEFDFNKLKEDEFSAFGFNLKYNIFVKYDKYFEMYKATEVHALVEGKKVNVVGQVRRVKIVNTKKGDKMAFITLDCNNQLLDVVAFSEAYTAYKDVFDSKELVLFNGVVRKRENELQLQLDKAKIL